MLPARCPLVLGPTSYFFAVAVACTGFLTGPSSAATWVPALSRTWRHAAGNCAIVILRRSLGGIHFLVGFFLCFGCGFNDAAIVFSQRSTS